MSLLSIFSPTPLRSSASVPTVRPQTPSAVPATLSEGVGVPTLHRTVVEYANFDYGATAPALVSVADSVATANRTYGSVHRGAGYGSQITTAWYEAARATIAEHVGARADDVTVITRNTTDAFSLLAHCLPSDTQVFVFSSVHHAALLAWPDERTTRLPIPRSTREATRTLERALAAATSVGPKLVVITGACNVTGEVWPIAELVQIAQRHGAHTVLDAAQLAPHRAINIEDLGVDYVALSGHKAYAPYGAGALVGRRDWLDSSQPYLPAGGASHNVSATDVSWAPSPARHEGGTPNALGAIALAAALTALAKHREAAEAHERALHAWLRDNLARIPGVEVHTLLEDATDNVGVTTFTVDGYDPTLVAQVLADEYGIAVRDGRFCAHQLTDLLVGPGRCAVRASLGLGTTAEHAQRLVRAIERLVTDGPAFTYEHVDGIGYRPLDDPRLKNEPLPW